MKTTISFKLVRKCLILVVMILGLVFVVSSDRFTEPAIAAECCEQCPGGGDPGLAEDGCGTACYYICGSSPSGCFQDCFDNCTYEASQCYSHCNYCNSETGGGGFCTSTSDCPIGYVCAADNTCHHY